MKIISKIFLAFALSLMAGLGFAAIKDDPIVEMKTNMGTIELQLDATHAPITVQNFLYYANKGFYNGTIFHRVIDGFMIQGGGFDAEFTEKPTNAPIKNEAGNGLTNKKYTIAMARTADLDSATAQFFINTADNFALDEPGNAYAVFGRVIKGMDVVDKISKVKTGEHNGMNDVPDDLVVIKSVKVIKK